MEPNVYCTVSKRFQMFKKSDYSLRDLDKDDLDLVLEWRNAEHVRAVMFTDHVISREEHHAWFEKIRHDETVRYLILQRGFTPEGVVNFTCIDRANLKCFWGFYLRVPPPCARHSPSPGISGFGKLLQ